MLDNKKKHVEEAERAAEKESGGKINTDEHSQNLLDDYDEDIIFEWKKLIVNEMFIVSIKLMYIVEKVFTMS